MWWWVIWHLWHEPDHITVRELIYTYMYIYIKHYIKTLFTGGI